MLARLLTAFAAALVLAAATRAQELPQQIAEPYLAYSQAREAGDLEAARDAARQAWEAAERLDYDAETTGILADNYGELSLVLGESGEALRAYTRSAEILQSLNADPALRGATWRLAALAAFRSGDYREAVRCAGTAADLLSPLAGPENPGVSAVLFEVRSIQAHAEWRRGDFRAAARHAEEAFSADPRPAAQWGGQHVMLAFYNGVRAATIHREEEAAYWLSAAYTLMIRTDPDSELVRPLYYWAQYARDLLEPEGRIALLDRLASENLVADSGAPPDNDRIANPIAEPDENNFDVEALERRPPTYPGNAAAAGLSGFALVRYAVDEQGRVADPEVLLSVPHPVFGEASVEGMERWRFRPMHVDGRPVRREGMVTTMEFMMEDD